MEKIKLMDLMKALNGRLGESFQMQWKCYGNNCYGQNIDSKDHKKSIGFYYDSETNEVYEVSVWDESPLFVFRWINPKFKTAYNRESRKRNLNPQIAIDDIEYLDVSPEQILKAIKRLKIDE